MALDRQINLFKVDTSAFLTKAEKDKKTYLVKLKKIQEKIYKHVSNRKKTLEETIKELNTKNFYTLQQPERCLINIHEIIKEEEKTWKKFILKSASESVIYNDTHQDKHIRELDKRYLFYTDIVTGEEKINVSNIISMFESTLSRSFNIKKDELTYDIFILEIFYYDIAKDLILNGFNYNGKHYIYFSSSAGQIRTKKAVFVEEEKYKQVQKKLMCGLTIDTINAHGGMNINKFLAYLALSNSATDLWEQVFNRPFDIDRCIVVDDFETNILCKVDDINYESYKIREGVKKEIPIPHSDGCGMISSDYCSKNFMVRLPFIKGLLGSFDFKKFIIENNCSGDIKDIWGKKYNIISDDIQVIFTKSQLKMYKYYESWDQYKEYFKKYGCEAGICNMEEDYISEAKINYQMLQTLYDATDEEIQELCASANHKVKSISDSLENALSFFDVKLDEKIVSKKDWFQKALQIYPELILDPATRQDLHDLKNSLIKKYKGGHLDVKGKFTFVLPDLYAFCEWLFKRKKIPDGLLKNNEVYCRLYKNETELDCLRSPHLYIEHAIRENVCNKEINGIKLSEWFNTDAIYTSTFDPISKILQFDVDGDRLLVLAQPLLIKMAKRVTKDVYPLYYEMKKANAEEINPHNIYKGLELAFTGGKIGLKSNDITKIWNSDCITEESKKAVKWLCMETNFTIDYAKTLFKPTRPEKIDTILKEYSKKKVPYFFQYAKDKRFDNDNISYSQCEKINNSTLNRITKEIKENRAMFRPMKNLEKPNYEVLLYKDVNIVENEELIKTFFAYNKKYGNNLSIDDDDSSKSNIDQFEKQIKEKLLSIDNDIKNVVNNLVSALYKNPSTRKKKLLWYLFGEELYNNILNNIGERKICKQCGKARTDLKIVYGKIESGKCVRCARHEQRLKTNTLIECVDCGEKLYIKNTDMKTYRCKNCQKLEHNRQNKEAMKRSRIEKKAMYSSRK